jgi:hypothetical protein
MTACPVCGEPGSLELAGAAAVTVGTVAAALEHRPVVACPHDHAASPPEVVGAAMEAAEAGIIRARSRLLRGDACRGCGSPLTMPVRRTERSVTVEAAGAAPFTLRFDLPVTRCPDCGLEQVPSRSQEDLVVVVPALFTAS